MRLSNYKKKMKIEEKISLLKKTINEIKNISEKLDNDYIYEKKNSRT